MNSPRIIAVNTGGVLDPRAIAEAVAALGRGALVIMPTDTVYGVAADPRAPGAVERLCRAKRRPETKPIPLLVDSLERIETQFTPLDAAGRKLASLYWPGALTLVVRVGECWEGFRVPNHPVALAVLRAADGALRVTSANLSGEPPALNVGDALPALGDAVELALDAGPLKQGVPSTVVRIGGGAYEILRAGAIPAVEIAAVCGQMGLSRK